MGSIKVLPPETARLIAAGEVIDRPASALRELLDNALDAQAREISVSVESGGIALIRVVDDGLGMDREDLELCVLPHATSKISSADDLLRAGTLGFRGEALASIAAAARLEILSKDEGSSAASRLVAGPGLRTRIERAAGRRGSAVEARGLFEDFPARRQFLKRPQAEAAACRQVFVDRALAHPAVLFRWTSGDADPEVLPASTLDARCRACFPELPAGLVHQLRFSGKGFSGEAVIAGPSFSRRDRRLVQVFVNRRRVQEWGLAQAAEYAFDGFLPGGSHPCALVFLEVDPSLADFNIHPAKREVRLKDPDGPRRALVSAIRSFLEGLARRDPGAIAPDPAIELGLERPEARRSLPDGGGPGRQWQGHAWPSPARPSWEGFDEVRERIAPIDPDRHSPPPAPVPGSFRYVGRALGPFILFESGDDLYFLDQHAAHERLIFDELSSRPVQAQELLVPIVLEAADEAEEAGLAALAEALPEAGFRVEKEGSSWAMTAAPVLLRGDPADALRELVSSGEAGPRATRAARALVACRAAVKDGEELDRAAAEELFARALALPEPRCPHGRPIWARVTREQLYRLVRRLV